MSCAIGGCDARVHAHGYCSPHAHRLARYGDPLAGKYVKGDLISRLASRIALQDDGCWVWIGQVDGRLGYGRMFTGTKRKAATTSAHRAVWEVLVGPIPDGLEPDHLCRNRACVNPEHIELVTHAENCQRGVDARRTG